MMLCRREEDSDITRIYCYVVASVHNLEMGEFKMHFLMQEFIQCLAKLDKIDWEISQLDDMILDTTSYSR